MRDLEIPDELKGLAGRAPAARATSGGTRYGADRSGKEPAIPIRQSKRQYGRKTGHPAEDLTQDGANQAGRITGDFLQGPILMEVVRRTYPLGRTAMIVTLELLWLVSMATGKTPGKTPGRDMRALGQYPVRLNQTRLSRDRGLTEKVIRTGVHALLKAGFIVHPDGNQRLLQFVDPVDSPEANTSPASQRRDEHVDHGPAAGPSSHASPVGPAAAVVTSEGAPDRQRDAQRVRDEATDDQLWNLSAQLIRATGDARQVVLGEVVTFLHQLLALGLVDRRFAVEFIADGLESNGLAPPGDGRVAGRALAEAALGAMPGRHV